MVEAVGHGNNTMPYNYNFMGNSLRELDRGDSLFITGNMRIITPRDGRYPDARPHRRPLARRYPQRLLNAAN